MAFSGRLLAPLARLGSLPRWLAGAMARAAAAFWRGVRAGPSTLVALARRIGGRLVGVALGLFAAVANQRVMLGGLTVYGGAGVTGLLVLLAAGVLVTSLLAPGALGQVAIDRLAARLGVPIAVVQAELRLLPSPTFEAKRLRVPQPVGYPPGELLRIERVHAELGWPALLAGTFGWPLSLQRLVLDRPQLALIVRDDGVLNTAYPAHAMIDAVHPPEEEPGKEKPDPLPPTYADRHPIKQTADALNGRHPGPDAAAAPKHDGQADHGHGEGQPYPEPHAGPIPSEQAAPPALRLPAHDDVYRAVAAHRAHHPWLADLVLPAGSLQLLDIHDGVVSWHDLAAGREVVFSRVHAHGSKHGAELQLEITEVVVFEARAAGELRIDTAARAWRGDFVAEGLAAGLIPAVPAIGTVDAAFRFDIHLDDHGQITPMLAAELAFERLLWRGIDPRLLLEARVVQPGSVSLRDGQARVVFDAGRWQIERAAFTLTGAPVRLSGAIDPRDQAIALTLNASSGARLDLGGPVHRPAIKHAAHEELSAQLGRAATSSTAPAVPSGYGHRPWPTR
ncbi:MAG: AsmA family protein [Geminicoccaceae bacterium]